MTSLIDDLRAVPTPLAVTRRDALVAALKQAVVAILRTGASQSRHDDSIESVALLRRYSLWLEEAALDTDQDNAAAFSLASDLAYLTATLDSTSVEPSLYASPLSDLLRSAILSSLSPYQANATVICRDILRALNQIKPESVLGQAHLLIARAITSFIGREFRLSIDCYSAMRRSMQRIADAYEASNGNDSDYYSLDRDIALGMACGLASVGMLYGVTELLQHAANQFEEIAQAALGDKASMQYWLADRLQQIAKHMRNASVFNVLGNAGMSHEYRRALVRDGIYEFWEPQLESIRLGLIDPRSTDHFVISVPTGAGKTLFAEMAIATALRIRTRGWAIYVAPTRALVSQISADLRRRLRGTGIVVRTILAGAEASSVLDEELELLTERRSVTVLTPEKLDAYLRNAPELFDTCRLAVFDEAHIIGDKVRGLLVESLITRLMVLRPDIRLILMSGVMSNAEELAAWLGADRSKVVYYRRRPTRQIRCVAVRTPMSYRSERREGRRRFRRVDFTGGLVVVHESEDLQGEIEVSVHNAFSGHYTESSLAGIWTEERTRSRSTINDHAVQVARSMASIRGTTLVFVRTADWAESCARNLGHSDDSFPEERANLAAFLRSELGSNHPLPDLCLRGVAYHHAQLPVLVQRAVELGLERGWLKFLFATTTLREGINTPATTVILAGHSYPSDSAQQRDSAQRRDSSQRLEPMSERDFANLAGRAGRPGWDTVGRVVLIPDRLATATEAGKRYILTGDEALRVMSQFDQLAKVVSEADARVDGLPTHLQSVMLGLVAANLTDATNATSFFGRTLWNEQEDDDDILPEVARSTTALVESVREEIGDERLKLASRLGLSLSSAESLRADIESASHLLGKQDPTSDSEQLRLLLAAALKLPEAGHGLLATELDAQPHIAPIQQWVAGNSFDTILESGQVSGLFKERADVGDAVRYASDVSTWLSWAFGAAVTVLDYLSVEPSDFTSTLPLLVKHGVPSVAAGCFALLGIADRRACIELSELFMRDGKPVSLENIAQWIDEQGDLLGRFLTTQQDDIRRLLLERQTRNAYFGHQYAVSAYRSRRTLSFGTILDVQSDQGSLYLWERGQPIAQVLDRTAVRRLTRETSDEFLAVVAAENWQNEPGRVTIFPEFSSGTAKELIV